MTALDWRGDWDILGVPALDRLIANSAVPWYDWEIFRERRDTAQWLLAVRSRRWVAEPAMDTYCDEATWWRVWTGVLALRWALAQRCETPDGFLPSTELALRPRFGISHLYQTDAELLAELILAAG